MSIIHHIYYQHTLDWTLKNSTKAKKSFFFSGDASPLARHETEILCQSYVEANHKNDDNSRNSWCLKHVDELKIVHFH